MGFIWALRMAAFLPPAFWGAGMTGESSALTVSLGEVLQEIRCFCAAIKPSIRPKRQPKEMIPSRTRSDQVGVPVHLQENRVLVEDVLDPLGELPDIGDEIPLIRIIGIDPLHGPLHDPVAKEISPLEGL